MPSDTRREAALAALAGPLDTFHSALAGAVEDVRTFLRTHEDSGERREDNDRAELGAFASGRIDIGRFSALVARRSTADSSTVTGMRRAHTVLAGMASAGAGPYLVNVPSGGDLRNAVAAALGRIGRAFGAARVAGFAREGSYDSERHDPLLKDLPFRSWSLSERCLAPPLVVEVDGGDLEAEGLGAFLDGAFKLVLVVRGEGPPAALARLVTPGTYVLQAEKPADLTGLAAWDGPGIAALVDEAAALFVHAADGGERSWDRLDLRRVPEPRPARTLGGASAAQQAEQVRHLLELATAPAVPEAPAATPVVAGNGAEPVAVAANDPVDKLAAWLLGQAGAGADGQ